MPCNVSSMEFSYRSKRGVDGLPHFVRGFVLAVYRVAVESADLGITVVVVMLRHERVIFRLRPGGGAVKRFAQRVDVARGIGAKILLVGIKPRRPGETSRPARRDRTEVAETP